jgi:hypothetical protein
VRCLGYLQEIDSQVLHINADTAPDQPGHTFWEDRKVCYSVEEDGVMVFNEEAAHGIKVSEEQQKKRSEGAAALMRDCIEARPMPERENGECPQSWEERVFQLIS